MWNDDHLVGIPDAFREVAAQRYIDAGLEVASVFQNSRGETPSSRGLGTTRLQFRNWLARQDDAERTKLKADFQRVQESLISQREVDLTAKGYPPGQAHRTGDKFDFSGLLYYTGPGSFAALLDGKPHGEPSDDFVALMEESDNLPLEMFKERLEECLLHGLDEYYTATQNELVEGVKTWVMRRG